MPELPEVETICRGLARKCVGAKVLSAHVHRPGFIRGDRGKISLLSGLTIRSVVRHGKQFAIESTRGRTLLFHMGMSGCLSIHPYRSRIGPHVHVHWVLCKNRRKFEIHHEDPRRFGWLRAFENLSLVREQAWSKLGPDALKMSTKQLASALHRRRITIKSALLDQSIIAGVGNIYVDESLFRSRIHPLRQAKSLTMSELNCLIRAIKKILQKSIRSGGSTIRSYADPLGASGTFQQKHMVYGRAGRSCLVCGHTLRLIHCAQRSTVFCANCQPRSVLFLK